MNHETNAVKNAFQRRNIHDGGHRTTMALEPEAWRVIDRLSDGHWRNWIAQRLTCRPQGYTRAAWARIALLAELEHRLGHTDGS